jgi:hypothetical protein
MGPRRVGIMGAGLLGALALMGTGASTASAASCSHGIGSGQTFFTGGGPSVWDVASDGTFSDAGVFTGAVGRYDAFDSFGLGGAFGTDYENPDNDGCTTESGGHELVFPADTTSLTDMTMRPKLFVSPRKPFGRILFTLRNTGDTDTAAIFSVGGNLGADSGMRVARSSSGDATVNTNDRWAVSCEDNDDDGCADVAGEGLRDPELAHILQARGANQLDAIALETDTDDVEATYQGIIVEAGKTKSVMYIVHLARTVKAAVKAAKAIDRNPARYGVFQGMSKNERKLTRNF